MKRPTQAPKPDATDPKQAKARPAPKANPAAAKAQATLPATGKAAPPPAAARKPSSNPLAPPKPKRIWSARRQQTWGIVALILLVGGLGTWSIFANIAGAIVTNGQVEVEAKRQIVQHPDGGVVGEINVQDGDIVTAGDVLIRFDDTLQRSELAIVEGQLFEIMARRGRLEAERDDADSIDFSAELLDLEKDHPVVGDLRKGQIRLFEARRESMARESSQLKERKIQIGQQIIGAEAQLTSLQRQQELISEELADQTELLKKGLAQATRVLSLQREEARLGGEVGSLIASIAESRGRIAETEIEILRLKTRVREEAITTLRDLQYTEIELRERRLTTLETLSRLDVRAPSDGIVYDRAVHAIRAVVRGAEPVMYIVPQDTPLVVVSRVPPIHIDQVRVGQDATLAFSTFDARTTPQLFGYVTKVSADIFTDEATGEQYYRAELLPKDGEIEKLEDQEVLPGMPVQAFIKTNERSPLNYLVKPMTDYFNKAFRES